MRFATTLYLLALSRTNAFVVPGPVRSPTTTRPTTTTSLFATKLPDISKMKASEMKKELQSYGISTKSLLEKKEFVEALKQARAEGKSPINGSEVNGKASESSRDARYQKAFQEAKSMKVKELKKALSDRGISTTSFFEKSEFIKAYATAVADGTGGSSPKEEPRDPSYRDVPMMKIDRRLLMGESIIDVKAQYA